MLRTVLRSRVSFAPRPTPTHLTHSYADKARLLSPIPPRLSTQGTEPPSGTVTGKAPPLQDQLAIIASKNAEIMGALFNRGRKDGVSSDLRHEVEEHRLASAARALEADFARARDDIISEWLALLCQDARQEHRERKLVEDRAHLCHTCGRVFLDQRKLAEHKLVHEQAAVRATAAHLLKEHRWGASDISDLQWASASELHNVWLGELQRIALLNRAPTTPASGHIEVDSPPPPMADAPRFRHPSGGAHGPQGTPPLPLWNSMRRSGPRLTYT